MGCKIPGRRSAYPLVSCTACKDSVVVALVRAVVVTRCKPGRSGRRSEHSRRPAASGPWHDGRTMTVTRTSCPERAPNSWGLGDGQAIPWEYAPAPESRDVVHLQERYGLFIGGRDVSASDGAVFTTVDPSTETAARRRRAGHGPGHGSRGAGRPDRLPPALGRPARPRAGQVPVPDRPDPPGAQPRVRRPREHGQRQADQGEPRRRRPARGGPLLVLRGLGRQARVRLPRPRRPAARRGRPDHPLELPAAHAGLEDRAGPGGRQHGRPQAGLHDAPDRPPVRGRLPPGRPPARAS